MYTSRVIIEETCSIRRGIRNIMSPVKPSCLIAPLICIFHRQSITYKKRRVVRTFKESLSAWGSRTYDFGMNGLGNDHNSDLN